MGRTKSEIPKGSFSLKAAPNAKGEKPVYLKYYVQGKYAKRSTDIWVDEDDWDSAKQCVKSKNKLSARINNKLNSIKKKVDDQLLAFKGGVITWDIVQQMLDGEYLTEDEKTNKTLFIDWCNKVNETQYTSGKFGYSVYYNAKLYIKQFEEYLKNVKQIDNLSLNQINKQIIDEYVAYKINIKGYKTNEGVNKSISPLIKAVKYAKDNEYLKAGIAQAIVNDCYLDIKNRTYNPEDTEDDKVRYLTDEQLNSFIEYVPKSSKKDATNDIKDIFLFSYYACGLRISDIVTLEWNNIDFVNKTIDKVQVKTKVKSKISPRLPEQAITILNKWKARQLNKRFVFNYLPENFVFSKETSGDLKKRINVVDRTINISLNKIGKNLKLPFSLSIHVARHTFCVKALGAGISLHLVSQLMGHQSILATEKTYANYLDKTIDTEISKIDGLFNVKE